MKEKPREIFFNNFLLDNTKGHQEFRLVADRKSRNMLTFYIHPMGVDGTTFDGYAYRDKFSINEKFSMDKLISALEKSVVKKSTREK